MLPTITLDGTQLHPIVGRTGYRVFAPEFTGWYDSPARRTNFADRFNAIGALPGPSYQDKRVITIGGMVMGADRSDLLSKQRVLSGLCSDPQVRYELKVIEDFPLMAHVQASDAALFEPVNDRTATFSLQLTAPDPRRYAVEWEQVQVRLPQDSSTGLDFTEPGLRFDLHLGAGSLSGSVILTNDGTAPTNPVITLFGPLRTPTLATTGGSLRYNAALADGEYLTIDLDSLSAMLNGTTPRGHLLAPAHFPAFTVPPGTSITVGLSHAGPSTDTGYVQFRYRPAWF